MGINCCHDSGNCSGANCCMDDAQFSAFICEGSSGVSEFAFGLFDLLQKDEEFNTRMRRRIL